MKNKLFSIVVVFIMLITISGCSKLENYNVSSEKEVTKEIGKYSILTDGMFNKTITDKSIKNSNIKMYEFLAKTTSDGEKFETNKWIGIKVADLFKYFDFKNFKDVYFNGTGAVSVGYLASEGFDNMYIVFYKNGVLLNEKDGPLFLSTHFKSRFWIYGLKGITFK